MQWDIENVAWTTRQWIEQPITGVIVSFHGLGASGMRIEIDWHEWEWAKAGGLTVFPYYGPWGWMNRSGRAFMDELIDKVYQRHGLNDKVPLILTGGSLGGYSSLLYARYARRPVAAVTAVSAVTDMKASYHERPDVPRTVLSAFQGYAEDLETLFVEHSPIHQLDHMPRIPYLLTHGSTDKSVAKRLHSDPMVAAMRARGFDVTYLEMAGVGHEEPAQFREKRIEFIRRFLQPTAP